MNLNVNLKNGEKLPLIVYINGKKYINENELTDLRFAIKKVHEEMTMLHDVVAIQRPGVNK